MKKLWKNLDLHSFLIRLLPLSDLRRSPSLGALVSRSPLTPITPSTLRRSVSVSPQSTRVEEEEEGNKENAAMEYKPGLGWIGYAVGTLKITASTYFLFHLVRFGSVRTDSIQLLNFSARFLISSPSFRTDLRSSSWRMGPSYCWSPVEQLSTELATALHRGNTCRGSFSC